jgi:cytochrome c-type biogenesis protein CcmH
MTTYVFAYLATTAVLVALLLAVRKLGSEAAHHPADLKTLDARLAEIDKKVRAGALSECDASTSRLDILSAAMSGDCRDGGPLLPFRRSPIGSAGLLAAAALLAAYLSEGQSALSPDPLHAIGAAQESEVLANLKDYALSAEPVTPSLAWGPMSRPQKIQREPELSPSLPDVDTMIERLVQRLQNEPGDAEGWRMLGWSYFQTSRFDEAEKAYAKALALRPESSEFKAAYEDAKAKVSATDSTKEDAKPESENGAMRSMVDGLASRLEASPRDAEGWIKLIRSRTVLGEKDAAATALRKALDVFKDEPEQMTEIAAAADELGVTGE